MLDDRRILKRENRIAGLYLVLACPRQVDDPVDGCEETHPQKIIQPGSRLVVRERVVRRPDHLAATNADQSQIQVEENEVDAFPPAPARREAISFGPMDMKDVRD